MTNMTGPIPIGPSPKAAPPKVTGPMPPSCDCADAEVDRLRDLIAAGVDQRAASRLIWSPPPGHAAPAPALLLLDPGKYARRFVRHALATRLVWLRLPALTGPEV